MRKDSSCIRCGRWKLATVHQCPPIFEGRTEGDLQWDEVFAVSSQEAAESLAEKLDDIDGDGPKYRVIEVRLKGTEEIKIFDIWFELAVDYTAKARANA